MKWLETVKYYKNSNPHPARKNDKTKAPVITPPGVSRSTVYRRRVSAAAREAGTVVRKTRKMRTCHTCNKPMKGHTHFRGLKYCPEAPNQIPLDKWWKQRQEAAAEYDKLHTYPAFSSPTVRILPIVLYHY